MGLREFFSREMTETKEEPTKVQGKIIYVSPQGYGFINSPDVKFTRIFFHWTALEHNTLKFTELRKGMKVEFVVKELEGQGTRAIKVKVIE